MDLFDDWDLIDRMNERPSGLTVVLAFKENMFRCLYNPCAVCAVSKGCERTVCSFLL
jgi:hypothetical protein